MRDQAPRAGGGDQFCVFAVPPPGHFAPGADIRAGLRDGEEVGDAKGVDGWAGCDLGVAGGGTYRGVGFEVGGGGLGGGGCWSWAEAEPGLAVGFVVVLLVPVVDGGAELTLEVVEVGLGGLEFVGAFVEAGARGGLDVNEKGEGFGFLSGFKVSLELCNEVFLGCEGVADVGDGELSA